MEQQRAYGAQKRRVLQAFSMTPKTMLMVEVELDVRRTNFTSLLNRMEKQGTIYKVRFSKCPVSKEMVLASTPPTRSINLSLTN